MPIDINGRVLSGAEEQVYREAIRNNSGNLRSADGNFHLNQEQARALLDVNRDGSIDLSEARHLFCLSPLNSWNQFARSLRTFAPIVSLSVASEVRETSSESPRNATCVNTFPFMTMVSQRNSLPDPAHPIRPQGIEIRTILMYTDLKVIPDTRVGNRNRP